MQGDKNRPHLQRRTELVLQHPQNCLLECHNQSWWLLHCRHRLCQIRDGTRFPFRVSFWEKLKANDLFRIYLDNVRQKKGPFTDEESFDASGEAVSAMEKMKLLLVNSTLRMSLFSNTTAESCWFPGACWHSHGC
jgi:hypothetical protein